jgi:uncharacterized membrane protein
MHIDRAALKNDARAAIRESATSPYLTALILMVIVYILGLLQSKLTGVTIDYNTYLHAIETGNTDYLISVARQMPGPAPQTIGALLSLMSTMVSIGFTIFCLLVSRRLPGSVGNLFDAFGNFFRFLWLMILIWIFVFLWSLLFIIPGIVASYRYRQAVYILIDNPDMRAIDCIKKSKEMMAGHKAELFVLDLSFLGWYLLSVIPFVPVYVYPYTGTTYAGYYNALLHLKADTRRETPDEGGQAPGNDLPPWEYKD